MSAELDISFVDRNSISTILGLHDLQQLQVFSCESQIDGKMYFGLTRVLQRNDTSCLIDLRIGGNTDLFVNNLWCQNLDSLDLNGCQLKFVPEVIRSANRLTFLSLENNEITDIGPLVHNSRLKVLHLARNCIGDLRNTAYVISQLSMLHVLDMRYFVLTRDNLFVPDSGDENQKEVSMIVLRTSFVLAAKNLKMLNQEPVTTYDRKSAQKKMQTLKRFALEHSQKQVSQNFNGWKPELYPLVDMTVDDEIILEVI